jgi:hypothetical protein
MLEEDVLRVSDSRSGEIEALFAAYGLQVERVAADEPIPGSYWGESEAGLVENRLYVRADTPLHSVLHEASHYVCMDPRRRAGLHRDAGGDHAEENAVCYLQILLADRLSGLGRARLMRDMDAWGYTFRLGNARAWFEEDADDARAWLVRERLIDEHRQPTGRLRLMVASCPLSVDG